MNRLARRLLLLLLGALLLSTAVLERPVEAGGGGKPEEVRLQLKWLHQAQFAGYYAARDRGYYADEGLDVTILPGGPELAAEDVVNAGAAEFGINWMSALLRAREAGKPLVNIAQIFQDSGMRLVAFKSSGIKKVEDLAGRRVGVWFSGNEYQFMALAAKFHLSPPAEHMTVVEQPFEMTPFLQGELDVAHAMTYNELRYVLHTAKRKELRIFDYNRLGVSILEDGIFAREDWLQTHPETAVKFLRASFRGWKWAVEHPEAAARMSFQYAGPEAPGGLVHQRHMARGVARLVRGQGKRRPIGYLSPGRYERTWKTLVEQGVLAAEPQGAYTTEYWRRARR
ncbi:MAG: ABC transporter substrate-binding protein [Armatimonadota bacterium]